MKGARGSLSLNAGNHCDSTHPFAKTRTTRLSIQFENFRLDSSAMELRRDGMLVEIKPRAVELLCILVANRERVVSKTEIFDTLWHDRVVSDAALTTTVKELRQALGDSGNSGRLIRTYYGRGLRFVGQIEAECAQQHAEHVPAVETMASPQTDDTRASTVGVLPFEVLSDDTDTLFLGDGLADDLIHALSRHHSFAVISRISSFAYRGRDWGVGKIGRALAARYLVHGRLRKEHDRIRLVVYLTDTKLGTEIWSERYDRKIGDIFDLQDEITELVVTAVAPSVSESERARSLHRDTRDLNAWESYHRGMDIVYSFDAFKQDEAVAYFDRAISADNTFGRAYAGKAYALNIKCSGLVYSSDKDFSLDQYKSDLAKAQNAVEAVKKLAPHGAFTAFVVARTENSLGNSESGIEAARLSIDLNPHNLLSYTILAIGLLQNGEAEEAIEVLERAPKLQVAGEFTWMVHAVYGLAFAILRDWARAIEFSRLAQSAHPDYPMACTGEILAHGYLGQPERAKDRLEALKRASFEITVERFDLFLPISCAQTRQDVHGWLRSAGVPNNSAGSLEKALLQ